MKARGKRAVGLTAGRLDVGTLSNKAEAHEIPRVRVPTATCSSPVACPRNHCSAKSQIPANTSDTVTVTYVRASVGLRVQSFRPWPCFIGLTHGEESLREALPTLRTYRAASAKDGTEGRSASSV